VDHARQVRSLYAERGLQAREIHSNMPAEEIEDVLQDLRRGRIDCIVQVRMLGEGFDHPNLSVAAIFQPFRSLSPYVQFIGRVMRVIHQNNPQHPDNRGVAVSHVGLNIDRHWEDFRRIDQEDQELIQGWLEAGDERPPADEPGRRRRLTPDMVVQNEIISHFIEQEYLDPMDDAALTLRLLGYPAKISASASSRLGPARVWSPGKYRSRPNDDDRRPAEGSTSAPVPWPAES
jgi:superfamily II DNA/RNA helicase